MDVSYGNWHKLGRVLDQHGTGFNFDDNCRSRRQLIDRKKTTRYGNTATAARHRACSLRGSHQATARQHQPHETELLALRMADRR